MTEQSQLGPSSDGTVMLDIGGDIGALILHTGPDLLLAEIEISRVDGAPPLDDGHAHDHSHGHAHDHSHENGHGYGHAHPTRTHVAVRERRSASGTRYAAIYPGLRSGDYTVWGTDGVAAATVTIVGGQVAELDWR